MALGWSLMGIASFDPIEPLTGCFHVTYRFVENGKYDFEQTLFEGKPIIEWIAKVSSPSTENGTTLQHWGVLWNNTSQQYEAQKHWSEEWVNKGQGQWRQIVYSPSGARRYTCEGKFRFNQLRCSALDAPKPMRDKNRKDYDRLDRENTFQLTPVGWVQSEKNIKKQNNGTQISNEVGWVEYRRVDEKKCEAAKQLN